MRRTHAWLALVGLALGACDDGVGPDPTPDPFRGVDFGIEEGAAGAHTAEGAPGTSAAPFDEGFAVAVTGAAVADSLGGIVLLSYDRESSDLFILQVDSDDPGAYACGPVETDAPCHGRILENVRLEGGVLSLDGRFDITEGRLTLETVGPEQLTGVFEARLERTHPASVEETLVIAAGRIAVDLLGGELTNGTLECVLALASGQTSCAG